MLWQAQGGAGHPRMSAARFARSFPNQTADLPLDPAREGWGYVGAIQR